MVTPKIKKYIRSQFEKISTHNNKHIIEKTCANSLRVNFVDAIFPEAKFIYIIRNGIDVTHSIMKRWESEFSLSYTLKKMKFVPKLDIPYYGMELLKNRIYKKNNNRLKFWGPKFFQDEELSDLSLEEISALQWVSCVDHANQSFNKIDSKRVFRLKYENFVTDPTKVIEKITKFIGLSGEKRISFPSITNTNIGKGNEKLDNSKLKKIQPIIKETMDINNYSCS